MAAHTPIAPAMSSPRPTFAFTRLQDLSHTLERLRGLQVEALRLVAFDDQLDELAAICHDLKTLGTLNSELGITDSALAMLLQLLDAAGKNPISPQGLHALLSPVQQRLLNNWNCLSDLI